ncbi:MAG TPA: hypothetical protein VIF61_00175 [Methylocystis sp.]|jgi:hypothetical protein
MSTREFDCIECGRHIVTFVLVAGAEHSLCVACLLPPGWFKDLAFRAVLDPEHDGIDAIERQQLREAR